MSSNEHHAETRTAHQLYQGLSDGRFSPSVITADECPALKKHCANVVSKLQKKIERSIQRGRHRIARRDQMKLCEGLAARLIAAWEGYRKEDAKKRRRMYPAAPSAQRPFSQIWNLAERLKNPNAPSTAFLRRRPKPKGGYRIYYDFNAFGGAKHSLFVNALKPFASFHRSQILLRGGRSAACKTLPNAMNSVSHDGTKFIEFDVNDFFPSFSREWLEEQLPAPKAMIRNSLLLEGWRIIHCGMGPTKGQQGLPPGSAASSFVAEVVMADVLRRADPTGFICLVIYSDNIGGLLPVEMDATALVEQLTKSFADDPAGPFRITSSGPSVLSVPFRFLGYWFEKTASSKARVFLPEYVWQLKEMEFITEFADAGTARQMIRVCERLRSYCAAFELAPERLLLAQNVLKFIHSELEYRESMLATKNVPPCKANPSAVPAMTPTTARPCRPALARSPQSFHRQPGSDGFTGSPTAKRHAVFGGAKSRPWQASSYLRRTQAPDAS